MTLGRHSNDYMTSFYIHSPSHFFVEYGWGGRAIDTALGRAVPPQRLAGPDARRSSAGHGHGRCTGGDARGSEIPWAFAHALGPMACMRSPLRICLSSVRLRTRCVRSSIGTRRAFGEQGRPGLCRPARLAGAQRLLGRDRHSSRRTGSARLARRACRFPPRVLQLGCPPGDVRSGPAWNRTSRRALLTRPAAPARSSAAEIRYPLG